MITVEVDGIRFPAKRIGKGQYSKVYQVGSRAVYYTRGDCSKEVLAMFQYDRMAHLPEIIRHNNINTPRTTWYVFSSPLYRNVTKKDRSAYELMNKIIQWYNIFYRQYSARSGINLMRLIVNDFKGSDVVPRSVTRAMEEIVDVASNCGWDNIGFDFHKKNFGVNEYGTLIFRDPFYVYTGE
jgi:hypothetical protein